MNGDSPDPGPETVQPDAAQVAQEPVTAGPGQGQASPQGPDGAGDPVEAGPGASGVLWGLITWPWALAMSLFYLAIAALIHYHKLAGSGVLVAGLAAFHRPLGRLLNGTLVESWRILNREAHAHHLEQERQAMEGQGATRGHFDYRPLVVLCTSAVALTLIEYYGDRSTYGEVISRFWPDAYSHHFYELSTFIFWSAARVVGYVLIPWAVVLFMPGERIRDYGLSSKGVLRHLWIYGLLFAIVVPAVVMVSYTNSFQHTYPFYKLAMRSWSDYLTWEVAYAVQFFALEVFFRGFMIHPLKRSMGAYAIFAMAVPYCMIHYHKPLPEVLGAIVAGIVLGTLSLRTGSIWCGVLIHVSVAWSMDALSMVHTIGFPGRHRVIS